MATTFQIPRILRRYCAGTDEIELTGSTVRELLDALHEQHPALYECICNETGAVRKHINLFINNEFIRDRDDLDTVVQNGDVVSVFQAVSGG